METLNLGGFMSMLRRIWQRLTEWAEDIRVESPSSSGYVPISGESWSDCRALRNPPEIKFACWAVLVRWNGEKTWYLLNDGVRQSKKSAKSFVAEQRRFDKKLGTDAEYAVVKLCVDYAR
jgi:hypothetical protein